MELTSLAESLALEQVVLRGRGRRARDDQDDVVPWGETGGVDTLGASQLSSRDTASRGPGSGPSGLSNSACALVSHRTTVVRRSRSTSSPASPSLSPVLLRRKVLPGTPRSPRSRSPGGGGGTASAGSSPSSSRWKTAAATAGSGGSSPSISRRSARARARSTSSSSFGEGRSSKSLSPGDDGAPKTVPLVEDEAMPPPPSFVGLKQKRGQGKNFGKIAFSADHATIEAARVQRNMGSRAGPVRAVSQSMDDFRIHADEVVGTGSFGAVLAATHIPSGAPCVMKILDKRRGTLHRVYFRREVQALMRFDCKYIPELLGAFEDRTHCYIALERRSGMDVFTFLESQPEFKLNEDNARFVAWQIVCALRHSHSCNVIHRDVKLENLLIDPQTLETSLIDFGLCFIQPHEGALCTDFCGSLDYASPEIVRKERAYLGSRADVWSLGVVIYILLFGITPFNRKHRSRAIRERTAHPVVMFPKKFDVDVKAVHLLKRMLDVDADSRLSMTDVYEHEWFASCRNSGASRIEAEHLTPRSLEHLTPRSFS